ncbi:M48 family metallopeptidase [Myxococcota bacterium]|nr:M48 family metallopeptidase [Myxococcota bacterium]
MEYVIAHELTHLRHRHHGPAFWLTLAEQMPDGSTRKAPLERWEVQRREL